jgi:hypothetical protein
MRLLKTYEIELVNALLMTKPQLAELLIPVVKNILVEEADDGGMGGLLFISCIPNSDRNIGKTIAEAEFVDRDGVVVSIELTVDNNDKLFELDVWKVDYTPVYIWPELDRITIKKI